MKKIETRNRKEYRNLHREARRRHGRTGRGGSLGVLGILFSIILLVVIAAGALYRDRTTNLATSSQQENPPVRPPVPPRDRVIPPVKESRPAILFAPDQPSTASAPPAPETPPAMLPPPEPAAPAPAAAPEPPGTAVVDSSNPPRTHGTVPEEATSGTRVRVIRGIEFVFVPGGEFMMGSGDGYLDEKPVHSVRVKDFYLGRFEVTQEQWHSVMRRNPSRFGDCSDCPVEQVSWHHVRRFLRSLSKSAGREFRLPTEAEWEYAARIGGEQLPWSGAAGSPGDYAWFRENARGKTHRVGQKRPNAFGLHDMSGNVSEWCSDWYDSTWYGISPAENPLGPEEVKFKQRVVRGGSWSSPRTDLKVTDRSALPADNRWDFLGFRVAMDAPREGR